MIQQPASALAEWKAHWPKVLAALLGFSVYAMVTYSFGLFIEPLEREFGWPRADLSLGLSIFTGVAVFLSPIAGGFVDRFGSRWIAIVGLILFIVAFASLSLANGSLMQWYGLWLVLAVVAVAIKITVWTAAISNLFSASRGLALAAMLCGTAVAQSLAPLLANWLIAEHGWRAAYQWIGIGWGGSALVLVALFFFDATGRHSGDQQSPNAIAALTGLSVAEAIRNPQLLRIAGANLVLSMAGAATMVHLVPILSGTGLTRSAAAEIAATAGIAGIIGKILAGWAMDRFRGNAIPFGSFALPAVGYALLLYGAGFPVLLTLGVMTLGFAAGAGLQVTTYLCTRYAGMRNFGKIYGTISSMLMLGTATGPWLAGRIHDVTGSYNSLLIAAIPAVLICAFLVVGLGPYPHFGTRNDAGSLSPATA